jgi:hypothetical protein
MLLVSRLYIKCVSNSIYLLRINIVYLLTRLRQYTKRLRLREVGGVLLLVILVFKFLKEVEAAKPKLGRGVSKEINVGTLNVIKEQYPITCSK